MKRKAKEEVMRLPDSQRERILEKDYQETFPGKKKRLYNWQKPAEP